MVTAESRKFRISDFQSSDSCSFSLDDADLPWAAQRVEDRKKTLKNGNAEIILAFQLFSFSAFSFSFSAF